MAESSRPDAVAKQVLQFNHYHCKMGIAFANLKLSW